MPSLSADLLNMDLPFSSGIGAGIFTQKTVAGTRGTVSIADSGSDSSNSDAVRQFLDEKSPSTSSERAGRFLTLSNVKSAIDVATSAIAEIADLNTRQAALAYEASELPTGVKTAELADEAQDIETRISEIYNTATFNNQYVLKSSNAYGADVSSAGLHDAIVVPGLSTFFTSAGVSKVSTAFSTQQNAATQYDVIAVRGEGLGTILGNYESAQGKAYTLLETTLVEAVSSPDVVTNIDDAQKIATDIANTIGSQFATEEAKQLLIDVTIGADPDTKKIADLLTFS